MIPDQNPGNGIITIRIVEGVLSRIDLHGNNWLRDSYISGRLRRWSTPPLNLNKLQEGLQLLRQNPNVLQINAELKPGNAPGEGLMDVRVVDQQPFRLGIQVDNQRPPSVGAEEISLLVSDLNLTGHSDPLDLRYGIANSGVHGFEFSGATIWRQLSVALDSFRHHSRLARQPARHSHRGETFTPLDITTSHHYGVVLRQPFYQTANQEAALAIGFDRRLNSAGYWARPFNISPGAVDGGLVVSVLRLSQEWIKRGQNHVLALRSTFNFGLDAFDATDDRIPGDQMENLLRWARVSMCSVCSTPKTSSSCEVAGQLTDDPLVARSKSAWAAPRACAATAKTNCARPWHRVVCGVSARLCFRQSRAGIAISRRFSMLAGMERSRFTKPDDHLQRTGLGLLLAPNRHISAQLYWGYRLRHVEEPADRDLQDLGLHFRVNLQAF